ncbi:hypothetical protein Dsin_008502 [Dipteronia sinensis]|uniref:Uncharacterized protein n=1 Tax=Dipteronia sinensis TaxID=43782 RepID=A0AAE0AP53_9ROSI|nr:hypothetical protein Dsin_008502 [Dipteronia sinensis]
METKSNRSWMEKIRVKLGFVGKLVVECEGKSGGLCLMWTDRVDISLISYSRFHIDVRVSSYGDSDWRFTGFCGHPEADQRRHAWSILKRLHDMAQLPWHCLADTDEILSVDEKLGDLARSRMLMESSREALDYCGLDDLGFRGPMFSWCNKRDGNELVQERLDRGVCNLD